MNAAAIPTIEAERLRLRGLRASDFEDYAALYADPVVVRFLGNGATWDRARAWRHMALALGHGQIKSVGTWVVEEKGSGAFLGMIGYWEPEDWPGLELSWHLAPRYWGRGFATEGARTALAHAFLAWRSDRIISLIEPANLASIHVAERIGERLLCRRRHLGREMLCFGLDRATYMRELAPAGLPVRYAR